MIKNGQYLQPHWQCVGILYFVQAGDFKEEDLERGLSVVSPEHLAKVFNLPESEMQIDYSKHISPEQMDPMRPVTRS